MADTGNGTTITFATSSITGSFEEIDAGESVLGKLEDSHLGTTGNKEFIPEDLTDPGEVKCVMQFASGSALPTPGTVETVTITYPLDSGQSTNATLAGTAFITRVKRPTQVNNQISKVELTVAWDGKTGPTFTVGS